jgi:FtsZ-interacting cell division protein ZipA
MTDLQTSLMAIGGTIVIGVIGYNKWQEYKARKTVERAFSSDHDDVLMKSPAPASETIERHEPTLVDDDGSAPSTAVPVSTQPLVDESVASNAATVAAPPISAPIVQKDLPVDDLIDCVIPITPEGPLRGEKILPTLQSLRHVGGKPVHFIGQRDDSMWEPIAHGGIYYALRAGVQLANRGGPLNEIEFSELVTRLRQIADDLDAEPDMPDMIHVMPGARGLHQFVTEYDAQLSVNVQSNSAPWVINTLLAALERQGFDLRPDGRLIMPDGDGGVLFSLSTNVTLASESTSRLTLLLDVPRVAQARDGFGAMISCARMLASRLDGTVVDDGNQPLSNAALEEIAGQVRDFYGHMEAADIPAGSVRAQRLFS